MCDPLVIKNRGTKAQEKQVTLPRTGRILFKSVTCFHLPSSLWCRSNYPDFKDEELRLQVLTGAHVSAEMVLEEGGGIKNGIYFIHIAPGDEQMLDAGG